MCAQMFDPNIMIDNTVFRYEELMNSSIVKYTDDGTRVNVTLYHIDDKSSTYSEPFEDVESIIGENSPLRFNKITNFPLMGFDVVSLNLTDSELGIDTDYEGDAVTLPSTLVPTPNDIIVVPILKVLVLFRITSVNYTTLLTNSYYKITYEILSFDDKNHLNDLEKQVIKVYECDINKIGTDEKVIITSEAVSVKKSIYDNLSIIIDEFKAMYYDSKYNCILNMMEHNNNNIRLYSLLQTQFINKHSILNIHGDMDTLMLSEEYKDPYNFKKYDSSIYKLIETKFVDKVKPYKFYLRQAIDKISTIFYMYRDSSVFIMEEDDNNAEYDYILNPDEYLNIRDNRTSELIHIDIIRKYIHGELTIDDINDDLFNHMRNMILSFDGFIYLPILIYIIRICLNNFITTDENYFSS